VSREGIPVGTMVRGNGGKAPGRLGRLGGRGFECVQIHWWAGLGADDPAETARRIEDDPADGRPGPPVRSLALYGNPLRRDSEGDEARRSIEALIDSAAVFGCSIIGLFTGRIPGRPWEDSLPEFTRVFESLAARAADHDVTLALENCPMGGDDASGDWNLAYSPAAWERLFNALPSRFADVLGLEWEPAHLIGLGYDPLAALDSWKDRIVHVHGKDARIDADGTVRQTLPGNGSTPWDVIFAVLKRSGYGGTVDIEGYHDADWSGDRELDGQQRAAAYLRDCRDGVRSGPRWSAGEDTE